MLSDPILQHGAITGTMLLIIAWFARRYMDQIDGKFTDHATKLDALLEKVANLQGAFDAYFGRKRRRRNGTETRD